MSGYKWAETVSLCAHLSLPHHSSHTGRSLWEQHLSFVFEFPFHLSLPLKALSVHCHASLVAWQSCAAVGSQCPCCYWEHFAIRTRYLASGNSLFMCILLTSLVVSNSHSVPRSLLQLSQPLLFYWQECRLTCASSDTNELFLKTGVTSFERRVGVLQWTKSWTWNSCPDEMVGVQRTHTAKLILSS